MDSPGSPVDSPEERSQTPQEDTISKPKKGKSKPKGKSKTKQTVSKKDPTDLRANPKFEPCSFWWVASPEDGYTPEDETAALEAKAGWVTDLLDKGAFGCRVLVPGNHLRSKARYIAGYVDAKSPAAFYRGILNDFKKQGSVWSAIEAFRLGFGIAKGDYSASSGQQNRVRSFQRYVMPRDRVGPDGQSSNNFLEVSEDMVRKGLPLESGEKTVATSYHYRAMVVAIGKMLLDYPTLRGKSLESDPELEDWYTIPCLLGFTLEEWNRGFYVVHHILHVRGEVTKGLKKRGGPSVAIVGSKEEVDAFIAQILRLVCACRLLRGNTLPYGGRQGTQSSGSRRS